MSETLLFFSLLNLLFHVLRQPLSLVNVSDLGKGLEVLRIPNYHGDMGKACVPLHTVTTISFLNYVFFYFISWQHKCIPINYVTLKPIRH
jgi:hypothetical protein